MKWPSHFYKTLCSRNFNQLIKVKYLNFNFYLPCKKKHLFSSYKILRFGLQKNRRITFVKPVRFHLFDMLKKSVGHKHTFFLLGKVFKVKVVVTQLLFKVELELLFEGIQMN